MSKTPLWLLGNKRASQTQEFSDEIAINDHKIAFVRKYCRDKNVLDLGCVQHNPENYRSKYWLHKAIAEIAKSLDGLDLYAEGVEYLRSKGFNVHYGNAEDFDLEKSYDVIVAGDLIEHLEDLRGFIQSCKRHLAPGGRLLISTPNPWHWRNVLRAARRARVRNNPEHTMWVCPVTLGQLMARHGMKIETIKFGSRFLKDKFVPLPKGIRHGSFHASIIVE